jgi:hypothetical protein
MKPNKKLIALGALALASVSIPLVIPTSRALAQQCPAFVPRVDPWRLQEPVLLGNAKASYFYKGVILAGDTAKVQAFLNCYDLTTKYHIGYASARKIWGACTEISNPIDSKSQTVCVAINGNGRSADPNIFNEEYSRSVAAKVF